MVALLSKRNVECAEGAHEGGCGVERLRRRATGNKQCPHSGVEDGSDGAKEHDHRKKDSEPTIVQRPLEERKNEHRIKNDDGLRKLVSTTLALETNKEQTYRMPFDAANHGNSACITSVQAHLFPFNRVTINVNATYMIPSTPAPTTAPINTVKKTDMNAFVVLISKEFT